MNTTSTSSIYTSMQQSAAEDAILVDHTGAEGRASLSRMLFKLFSLWQLTPAAERALLGLNPNSRISLKGYRSGKPLANSQDLLERAGHLLAIHKSLRILFSHDRDLAYSWVNCPNKAFSGKTPLEVMIQYRFAGLIKVRAYLESARDR